MAERLVGRARKGGAVLVNIAVRDYMVTALLTYCFLAKPSTIDIVPCDSKKDEQQGAHGQPPASSRSSNILTAITTTTTSLLRHHRSSLINGSLPVVSRVYMHHLLTLHFFCVCTFFQYGFQWERS